MTRSDHQGQEEDRVAPTADCAAAAAQAGNVTFAGLRATYRYLDMDETVWEALDCSSGLVAALTEGRSVPQFNNGPILRRRQARVRNPSCR